MAFSKRRPESADEFGHHADAGLDGRLMRQAGHLTDTTARIAGRRGGGRHRVRRAVSVSTGDSPKVSQ